MPSTELLQKCWEIALSQGGKGMFPPFYMQGRNMWNSKTLDLLNINVACVSCSYSVFCLYVVGRERGSSACLVLYSIWVETNSADSGHSCGLPLDRQAMQNVLFSLILPSQLLNCFVWNCPCMSFFWSTWPKNVFLDGYSCDVIGSFKKDLIGQKAFDTILENPA